MLFKNLKWKRAIYKGDINNVERILADGIDINEWIDGKTPLELAISRGHKHIMEFLLRNGASQEDLVISYYDYCDVLHLTVIHNKIDLINPVIEYTGRLNPQIRSNHEEIDGLTPLLLSLKIMKNFARENRENEAKGYEDIALRLIELGADLKIIAKNQ